MNSFENFTDPINGKSQVLTLTAASQTLNQLFVTAGGEVSPEAEAKGLRLAFQGDASTIIGHFQSDGTAAVVGDSDPIYGGDIGELTKSQFDKVRFIGIAPLQKINVTQFTRENRFNG